MPRVRVVNADAFVWLDQHEGMFDFIVIDFPDPSNYHAGKLYTSAFYRLVRQHLTSDGFIAVQSTSPLFARQSFWSIVATLQGAGLRTLSYTVNDDWAAQRLIDLGTDGIITDRVDLFSPG